MFLENAVAKVVKKWKNRMMRCEESCNGVFLGIKKTVIKGGMAMGERCTDSDILLFNFG